MKRRPTVKAGKERLKLNNKKKSNLTDKWANDVTDTAPKKIRTQTANELWKHSAPYVMRELKGTQRRDTPTHLSE